MSIQPKTVFIVFLLIFVLSNSSQTIAIHSNQQNITADVRSDDIIDNSNPSTNDYQMNTGSVISSDNLDTTTVDPTQFYNLRFEFYKVYIHDDHDLLNDGE